MIQTIYSSLMKNELSEAQLAEWAAEFSARNQQKDITGLLYCHKRTAIQVLEGPESSVRDLLGKIERDSRHSHLFVLIDRPITQREFPDWSMDCVGAERVKPRSLGELGDDFWSQPSTNLAVGLLTSLREELLRTSIHR